MDPGFYGIGLPHPGVECFLAQTTKLLTHYGSKLGVGIYMQMLMELLVTELGLSLQPLTQSYPLYHDRVTSCWLKAVWEKAHLFDARIGIAPLPLQFLCEQDRWLMECFGALDFNQDELIRLSRFKSHQQVLFLLDILDASGKAIDQCYMRKCQPDKVWSTLTFPQERPPARDLRLRQTALMAVAPQGRLQDRLGRFIHKGHKIWPWQYDEENAKLFHLKGSTMDVYTPSQVPRFTRRPNCWTQSRIDQPNTAQGQICLVKETSLNSAVYNILCHVEGPLAAPPPTTFWEVLLKWEGTWMWENLVWTGNNSWIAEAIADDTCIAVTDGSYMADLYPQLHSAALVLECTRGRGRLWCSSPNKH
jgi:hypothetical protein